MVIVVAYHSDDHLADALARLGGKLDVVVVDNDASPTTAWLAEASRAGYLPTARNLGFAAAVNIGLREAWDGKRDVLLLNPDAKVSCRDVLALQQVMRAHPRLAAVGPRLTDDQGRNQRADWPIPSPGQVWFDALALGQHWHGLRFVAGPVLLLRAEALAQVGEFDERYFLYAEEADWQFRAQRLSWKVRVVGSVTATHVGGASSNDPSVRDLHFRRSGAAFADRWYSRSGVLVMRLGSIVAAGRRAVFGPPSSRSVNRRALRLYVRGGLRQVSADQKSGAS